MRRTKVLWILFLVLLVSIIPFSSVNAHNVDLDPEKLITFPIMIFNGEGNISIANSQTGYSLYYQAVEMSNADYTKIEQIKANGKTTLDALDAELETLNAECDNLKTIYDEAFETWKTKKDNGASEDELATFETACETALTNYQNKVAEYKNKAQEYKTKQEEINSNMKALVPSYVEDKWIKTEDGKFKVDLSQFSGNKAFAIWAKLVGSDGTISYDEATYTMAGTKPEEIDVESISLDKTSVSITEGSNYTLVATINPTDATNKLIVWSSDNENVAKVENGKITAISEGSATITATTKDGGHTATCKVTVTKKTSTTAPNVNKENDKTVAEGKLPQTGSMTYIIIFIVITLGIFGVVTYKKVKHINF